MNKVIYSHWSKPAKDNFVGFRSKQAFSNCAQLSLYHSKKWFKNVELVTDEQGYNFLIKELQLPFTNVVVELNKLDHIHSQHWSLGKIYSCKIQKEPFMHQDFDVVWFKKPKQKLFSADAAFQSKEIDEGFHSYYRPLMNHAKLNNFTLNKYCNLDTVRAYNCGIIAFNDLSILDKWWELALDYAEKNNEDIGIQFPPILFEQFLIYYICEHYKLKVETIAENWIDAKISNDWGYMHLIASSKRDAITENRVYKTLIRLQQELN